MKLPPANEEYEIHVDYKYKGLMYNIKILDSINFPMEQGMITDRVLLARKQGDKNWRLILVLVLDFSCCETELIKTKNPLYVSENQSIVNEKHSKKELKIIDDVCDKFFNDYLDDTVNTNGTNDNVEVYEMLYYYFEWFAQKRTKNEINKLVTNE